MRTLGALLAISATAALVGCGGSGNDRDYSTQDVITSIKDGTGYLIPRSSES